ncbi:hypothetical protein L4G92_05650 [Neisseria sp. ZJ106]|uniref:Lipoprotein n=1 Tax=Neisseria lisongii TaxID=2912188 RepID=A0ABY7RHH1_9NEIS|nr:hypothetical protein [Neisseria lisongii]MCF7521530.1 hypothetical protein [Neisseria lisongii]WCL71040.1 hypothetical protein PJU73_06685 [Neisseria lisongii]
MKTLRYALPAAAALLLAACAATPEQLAQRAATQKRYEQNLQLALAAQCDQETALLMRRQFELSEQAAPLSETDQAFRLRYIDKTNDPLFKACYQMAWQNYISQQQLREIRYRRDYWDDYYYPFRRPLWW